MNNIHKKSKKVWKPTILIKNLMSLIGIFFIIWFAISMIQCWMHHADYLMHGIHYTYPDWNIFLFIIKLFH